jgi:hypothetical protein
MLRFSRAWSATAPSPTTQSPSWPNGPTPQVQEIVVINQARILRAPQILDALLANPHLTAEARRRALETREEFFDKKARIEAERILDEEEADLELADDAIADLLAKAAEEDAARIAQRPLEVPDSELKDPKKQSIFTQLLFMTIAQKVQRAFKGGKTERMILIRDHNRLIAAAVMRNRACRRARWNRSPGCAASRKKSCG